MTNEKPEWDLTQEELDKLTVKDLLQLQIKEYQATNRHGPGDHSFMIPTGDRLYDYLRAWLYRAEKKLDAVLAGRSKE